MLFLLVTSDELEFPSTPTLNDERADPTSDGDVTELIAWATSFSSLVGVDVTTSLPNVVTRAPLSSLTAARYSDVRDVIIVVSLVSCATESASFLLSSDLEDCFTGF